MEERGTPPKLSSSTMPCQAGAVEGQARQDDKAHESSVGLSLKREMGNAM